jgi:SAM-dependent methyltransferase
MLPPIPKDLYQLYSNLPFWERWHVWLRWRLCPFLTIAAHVPPEGMIADIGCGRGMLANYLALTGPARRVVGIDKQEVRIKAAKSTGRERSNITFRFQDGLDIKQDVFDCIIMSDFLHHLTYPQQEQLIKHCYAILPDDGLLLIEDVGDKPRWKWYSHFIIDRTLNFGKRQNFRHPDNWIRLLAGIGFTVTSVPAHKGIPLSDVLFICVKNRG